MSVRTKRKIEAARKAADMLDHFFRPFEAEAVRELCRSNAQMSETLSRLHSDNNCLRDELGVPALGVI